MPVPRLAHSPWLWLFAFGAWFVVQWHLSSGPIPVPEGPDLPGLDKLLHFGYYFGGAGLLGASLFRFGQQGPSGPRSTNWPALITIVVLVVSAVGALDEWHQSWVPERTGNDLGDWIADVCGAIGGSLVFRRFHRHLVNS